MFGLLQPEETAATTLSSADPSNTESSNLTNQKLVTLDVDQGGPKGKHAATDATLAAPQISLPDLPQKAGDTANQVRKVLEGATPGRELGQNVAGAAKPDKASGATTLVRPSVLFTPPSGDKSGTAKGGTGLAAESAPRPRLSVTL